MASISPAGSPPAPSPATLPNPRKRPSLTASTGPGAKRRKPSVYSASGSAHPLRQTSFPPEDSAFSAGGLRSPSVETDITQSVAASGVSGGKRGRKRKSGAGGDTASVRSGPSAKGTPGRGDRGDTASRANGTAGGTGAAEAEDGAEEDDDEDDVDLDVDVASRAFAEERARFSALFEVLDEEQQDRLTQFRRFHLSEVKVRRIVNQTLSQSVPKSVITAVNSYTKYFVGSLIERAIEIQRHDDLAAIGALIPEDREEQESEKNVLSSDKGNPASNETASEIKPATEKVNGETSSIPDTPNNPSAGFAQGSRTPSVPNTPTSARPSSIFQKDDAPEKIHRKQNKAGKEIDTGPLRPDSLREALRRMKREGEWGGVGMEGFSTGMGISGSKSSMMTGRRLFR